MRTVPYAVLLVLLIPSALGLTITEVHPAPTLLEEYVELWVDSPNGTLVIEDNYETDTIALELANYTGPILIVEDAALFIGLECPIIELSSRIGNGLANGGDRVHVTLGNKTDAFVYTSSEPGMSYSRCVLCDSFVSEEPTPCIAFEEPIEEPQEEPIDNGTGDPSEDENTSDPGEDFACDAPTIEAEPIQEDRITYRIRSGEAYEYWIEDAFGETVRERSSSETDATKQYTPHATAREHLFRIHARNTCGREELVVGFISEEVPECELSEEQVIEAITDSIATHICRPHIEQAALLEAELDACENPDPLMTSFYTRSRSANETYTYRSLAKSNATYYACSATEPIVSGEDISIVFEDSQLANATPMLIAVQDDRFDVRIGTVAEFVGTWIDPDAPDDDDDGDSDAGEGDDASGDGAADSDGSDEEPTDDGPADEDGEETLTGAIVIKPEDVRKPGGIAYAIRRILNTIRTDRTVQSATPWIVPISFGIAGLTLALPRT